MKINSDQLLQELSAIAKENIRHTDQLQNLGDHTLNYKAAPDAWSILECLEHLNRYALFYLPETEKALRHQADSKKVFKSRWIGNMMVNMVLQKKNSKKMKTFTNMNPNGSKLTKDVIEVNLKSQKQLLDYIVRAESKNLNKASVPVTFSKFIKLKLGDTLRFMVYHNQRHIQQALRNVEI